ncbi:hypothetical protein Tco_0971605 [Tanacetum coccineum]
MDHPKGQILGDPTSAVQTRGKIQKASSAQQALTISQALQDESWVEAMQEELLQFKLQKVWVLVDLPYRKKVRFVADILKKFDFLSIRTATTPIESNKPLVKDEDGVDVDIHVYRSMIGSLMYLTASRPDIMYLKHQPKLSLWYPRDLPSELEAFSDSAMGLGLHNQIVWSMVSIHETKVHIDNDEHISVIKNPVAHSRDQSILRFCFHFIRDCYEETN